MAEDEVVKALKSLNKRRAAGICGLTTEHLACVSNELIPVLTALLNCIFHVGGLPYSLKLGLLTHIIKKKGSNIDAKNYRGITILPILSKLLESILHERIKPHIEATQNSVQKGFTKNSSPMNCALKYWMSTLERIRTRRRIALSLSWMPRLLLTWLIMPV